MNLKTMQKAKTEAKRFLKRISDLENRMAEDNCAFLYGCAETSAVRRASMELTRALANMRRP